MQQPIKERDPADDEPVDTASFVDRPFDRWRRGVADATQGPPVERRESVLRLRARPSVMLVQVERGEEPLELGLAQLPVQVLRVRYPLPASVRILVMRPLVIIIGPAVVERDLRFVFAASDETGAAALQLGSVARSTLGSWLRRAIDTVTTRRREPNR